MQRQRQHEKLTAIDEEMPLKGLANVANHPTTPDVLDAMITHGDRWHQALADRRLPPQGDGKTTHGGQPSLPAAPSTARPEPMFPSLEAWADNRLAPLVFPRREYPNNDEIRFGFRSPRLEAAVGSTSAPAWTQCTHAECGCAPGPRPALSEGRSDWSRSHYKPAERLEPGGSHGVVRGTATSRQSHGCSQTHRVAIGLLHAPAALPSGAPSGSG